MSCSLCWRRRRRSSLLRSFPISSRSKSKSGPWLLLALFVGSNWLRSQSSCWSWSRERLSRPICCSWSRGIWSRPYCCSCEGDNWSRLNCCSIPVGPDWPGPCWPLPDWPGADCPAADCCAAVLAGSIPGLAVWNGFMAESCCCADESAWF